MPEKTAFNPPPSDNTLDTKAAPDVPELPKSPEEFHKEVVGRLTEWDCWKTVGEILDDNGKKDPQGKQIIDSTYLPPNIWEAIKNSPLITKLEQGKAFEFPYGMEETITIIRKSTENAELFQQKAESSTDPKAQEYKIMAAEARFIPAIMAQSLVINPYFRSSTREGGWQGEPLNGMALPRLRKAFIDGQGDIKGYSEFEEAVQASSLAKSARLTVEAFQNLQKLRVSSFRELFNGMGMDQEGVHQQAEQAAFLFKAVQPEIEDKIRKLVAEGVIPNGKTHTYAAYAKAALLLDQETNGENGVVDPEQLYQDIARQEGVDIPAGSNIFIKNSPIPFPAAALLAIADKNGENVIGVATQLPENSVKRRDVAHEAGHALHALSINSPFLATMLPRQVAERMSTFIENKYGGHSSRLALLSILRFALLNEAQLRYVDDVDQACREGNAARVEEVLRNSLEPTETMTSTFGRAVAGEGYGLPFGAFGMYGSANTAVLELTRNNPNISLREVIEESLFS